MSDQLTPRPPGWRLCRLVVLLAEEGGASSVGVSAEDETVETSAVNLR